MAVYQKDVCPRCRADVSRRLGVITTPTITCRVCQFPMRVTALAVMNNWQFNFAAPVVLAIWVGAVVIIFRSPETVAHWARELRAPPTGHDLQDRLAMSLTAGVVALFSSIPFAVLGRLIGFFVARRLLSEPSSAAAASEFGQRQFLSQLPAPALPQQKPSGGYRFMARAFFGLLWATVFFFGGAFAMATGATAGIADPQLRNQASRHAGEQWGPWLFLGSIGLTILLGSFGVLPGTRSKKRQA